MPTTFNGAFTARATASTAFAGTRIPKATTGFPYKQLGLKVELLVNTTWTDITKYTMVRDDITISPFGRTDETSQMQPGQMTITLKNTDGRFTPNNASGAYYPYVQLNTQFRLSVTDTSSNGTAYSGYRFWGEVNEWPPVWDTSGRDVSATITVSGIWRRLSQGTKTLGSPFTRWNSKLPVTVAGYWPMEDGTTSTTYASLSSTGAPMTIVANTPTNASCTAFPGSDAIPSLNGAELSGVITTSSSPSQIMTRFCLFVQSGGDTGVAAGPLVRLHLGTNTSLNFVDISLAAAGGGPFTITGKNSGGGTVISSTLNDSIWGKPILCQLGLIQSGSNVIWSFNTMLPGTTGWYGTTTGTATGISIADASSVIISPGATWQNVAVGQVQVLYGNPSIIQDAHALAGWATEDATTRFNRVCTEEGIATENIGGLSGTPMGPQIDDTLVNVLQSIEDTDGGLIYETRDKLGLGYRTMNSLQGQVSALTLDYPSGQIAPSLTPVNDDALTRNDVTLANYDGYSLRTFLSNGARSLNPPPNGVGTGYAFSKNVNSMSHTQIATLGAQILDCGCTFENRYPTATVNLARITTASLFNKVPSMRVGDFLTITNMPSFMGGGTEKQLTYGWTETLSNYKWTIAFNTIPELPWEASFNPGTSATGQVPGSPVTAGQSNSVGGAQIAVGAVLGLNIAGGTVQGSNIANSTISAANIAAATITAAQIANATITGAQIAAATITGSNIGSATITGTNLASATITGTNIAAGTITGTQIASATITGANIGSATITGSNLTNNTITATQIANATITGTQIASGTITATNITNATITSTQISATAGITGGQIAGTTITAGNISNATITNVQIAAGSITGSNIGASTITGSNLTSGTITTVQIANGTITTTDIATGTVTGGAGGNLAASTVTASNIAAATITATQIAANTITAGNIVAGSVLAGAVNGTTITGATFVADGATGQFLIYSGTPTDGNLIGSWSGVAGTDSHGNPYPSGLSVQQGVITGITIDSVNITNATLQGDVLDGSSISNPSINGGTMTETMITFDQSGGQMLVYASTTTVITQSTPGTYTFSVPSDTNSAKVECWAAGQGGDGGKTSLGGSGGNGGSYAADLNYSLTPSSTVVYIVGKKGDGGTTGPTSHGTNGGDSLFGGVNGVHAIGGGQSYGPYNPVHHAGGTGGAASGNTGGSSGGNSGTPTAVGNSGAGSTGSTGHAAPTAQTGSGQGAPGGSSGSNANTLASTPGGGGGGAGNGTVNASAFAYGPRWVGSYYGPDASSSANGLRSSTILRTGVSSRGSGQTSGNQRAIIEFDTSGINFDMSGLTAYAADLTITNQSTTYAVGMTLEVSYDNSTTGSTQLSTYPTGHTTTHVADWFVPAGTTLTIPLGQTLAQALAAQTVDSIILGADIAASYAGGQDWQGAFDATTIQLTVRGTPSTSAKNGSQGGAGQVQITYTSGQSLIGAISPASGTDVNSNAFAGGFTGNMTAIQPGSSPTAAETWHTITMDAGWSTVAGFNTPSYRMLPNGDVEFSGAASHAAFGVATQNFNGSNPLPAAYRPTNEHVWRTGNGGTVADSAYQNTGVIQGLGIIGTTIRIYLDGVCPLN